MDRVAAVAADQHGNVIVTGTSAGDWSEESYDDDYLTVKHDGDGRHLWTARFTFRRGDRPFSLALDTMGDAYVSGDPVLVKYSPEGRQHWSIFPVGGEAKLAIVDDALIVGDIDLSQPQQSGRDFSIRKFVQHTSAVFPRFTRLPTTQRVPLTSNAVFSVSAEGDSPLTYKWRFSSRPFSQSDLYQTFPLTLVVSNVSRSDVGECRFEIWNRVGTVASPVVRLEKRQRGVHSGAPKRTPATERLPAARGRRSARDPSGAREGFGQAARQFLRAVPGFVQKADDPHGVHRAWRPSRCRNRRDRSSAPFPPGTGRLLSRACVQFLEASVADAHRDVVGGVVVVAVFGRLVDEALAEGFVTGEIGVEDGNESTDNGGLVVTEAPLPYRAEAVGETAQADELDVGVVVTSAASVVVATALDTVVREHT